MFNLRIWHIIFQCDCTILYSYYQSMRVFNFSCSSEYEVTPHSGFNLQSLMTNYVEHSFICLLAILHLLCEV